MIKVKFGDLLVVLFRNNLQPPGDLISMKNANSSQDKISKLPTIPVVAESTHYLVGRYNSANSFTGLLPSSSVASFNSLSEAKDYLRRNKFISADIEFQSAYDEMCGSQFTGTYRELVSL